MPNIKRELIGVELGRASRLWRTRLDERLAPLGLTQAKWLVLLHLSRAGGVMPQKELAQSIGVEGPTMVRVLDGLERRGLTERLGRPEDRRVRDVRLTEAAGEVLGDIMRVAGDLREKILAGLSEDDLTHLHATIAAMLRNMERAALK